MKRLSSRERILTAVRHQDPDYVPLNIDVHPSFAAGGGVAAGWTDQFTLADGLLALGTDPFLSIWLPDPCFHADVSVRSWKEKDPQTGQVLLGKEYRTPAGVLRQVIRETEDLYTWHRINRCTLEPLGELIDGVGLLEDVNPSRCVEFPVKGPEDLAKMEYLFRPPDGKALENWREAARFAKREARRREVLLVARRTFCGSAVLWLTRAEEFIPALSENREFVREFLRIIQDWQNQLLDLVLELGVEVVSRFGYYDTPDFWGVEPFREYLAPLLTAEAKRVHTAGALLCQQQSMGLTPQRSVWREIPMDILRDVDPVQGHEDLAVLKRDLGAEKTLWGAINADLMLVNAAPEEIDRTVRETIRLLAPGGGFVLAPIPALYAGVPWEKVLALITAWKKYRTYPIGG